MFIDRFIPVQAKALATDFEGDDLFIRKGWRKSRSADALLPTDFAVFVAYQTVHMNDKIFSIHYIVPSVVLVWRPLFYWLVI